MSEESELVELCRFHRVDAKNCHECRKVEPQTVLTEAGMERAAREMAAEYLPENYGLRKSRVLAIMKKHAGGGK